MKFSLNNKDIVIFISEKTNYTLVQRNCVQFKLKSNHVLNEASVKKINTKSTDVKTDSIVAGLYGKVVEVLIKPGELLQKGQDLVIIESMKSEITIKSPVKAQVKNIRVKKGETVKDENILVEFEY